MNTRSFVESSLCKPNTPLGMCALLFHMKFTLKFFLLIFSLACLSPAASAMSLGEAQIISRVGEPFSANISLVGVYDKDVKFYQVKGSECRSSLIGSTTAGCDSVYEGRLTFFIKKRPDGQYFLRVAGERSEDFFYRVIIKYKSPSSGSVYKTFDFLPEFKNNNDAPPAASNDDDVAVNTSLPPGKYGVLMGNVVEVPSDIEDKPALHEPVKASPAKSENLPAEVASADVKTADNAKQKRGNSDASAKRVSKAKRQPKKVAAPELLIKKEGSFADEIFVLQKENEAIEQQIMLLEKQIALLKEVDRLKAQAGAVSAPALTLEMTPAIRLPESSPVAVTAPAPSPVKIPVQIVKQPDDSSFTVLSWILIIVICLLLALLWFLYRRQKSLLHKYSLAEFKSVMVSPASGESRDYLDLTGEFSKK